MNWLGRIQGSNVVFWARYRSRCLRGWSVTLTRPLRRSPVAQTSELLHDNPTRGKWWSGVSLQILWTSVTVISELAVKRSCSAGLPATPFGFAKTLPAMLFSPRGSITLQDDPIPPSTSPGGQVCPAGRATDIARDGIEVVPRRHQILEGGGERSYGLAGRSFVYLHAETDARPQEIHGRRTQSNLNYMAARFRNDVSRTNK